MDDYRHVALSLADWSVLDALATVTVFSDYLADSNAVVALIHIFYKAKQGRKEMLSSTSGFQRLSQAALSRSRFLQLAAGALLPFAGLPRSAAADENSELAQNGGAPGTRDAAAQGRMGAILVSQFGSVKIHSYLSPLDGFQVNTR